MTADEAKKALKEGKRVTHKSWHKDNYLSEETHIVYNDTFIRDDIFENIEDGWEIYSV